MKIPAFCLALLMLCFFLGCGKIGQTENSSETTVMTPSVFELSLPQVTVSNSITNIAPEKMFVCSTIWAGEGFTQMDGEGILCFLEAFEQLAPSLPELSLGSGILLSHGEEITLYNSSREKLEDAALSDAYRLESGLYYVRFTVTTRGAEYNGITESWTDYYLFKLIVEQPT